MDTTANVAQEKNLTGFASVPGSKTACIAIIWLKSRDNKPLQAGLLDELRQARGVEDASYSPSRARVIVVRYEHGTTQAGEVLQMIRRRGYEAVIVGC